MNKLGGVQMKTQKINVVLFFLAGLVLALFLTACGAGDAPNASPTQSPAADTKTYVSATGIIVPSRWTMLSIPSSGVVESVFGKENQAINSGDVLVSLKGKAAQEAQVLRQKWRIDSYPQIG